MIYGILPFQGQMINKEGKNFPQMNAYESLQEVGGIAHSVTDVAL
jgi:hypothetical protein